MAPQIDALQSFVHLNDSVPSWLSKLDEITVSVAEHNARFLELARFGTRLLPKKNASTESLREGPVHHCTVEGQTAANDPDLYVPPNPVHQCLPHASRARNAPININLRKRKGSKASITSGQPRYRTKSMVVVYYDSAVQEAFESLFRSIAGARSSLRKGKTSASFKARMASLGMQEASKPVADELAMLNPKTMKTGLGRRAVSPVLGADAKLSAFDDADKDLEVTQSLCEVAAHQCLRDGDCRLEVESMREKFENCRIIAKREIQRLKEEEALEEEEKKVAAKTVQEEVLPAVKNLEAEVNPPPPLKGINFTGTGIIEIDDRSDPESVHFDISAFKARTRRV